MMRRVRVHSPLIEATFVLRESAGEQFVDVIEDVQLPVMTNFSFELVEAALRRASVAAFGVHGVPLHVEELEPVESSA
jgi:hypothetical protein